MSKQNVKKELVDYVNYCIAHGSTAPVIVQGFVEILNSHNAPANSRVKVPKVFKKAKSMKWKQPIMNGYLMKCRDCGLVHEAVIYEKNKSLFGGQK